jgi:hypothetical protein
MPYCAGAAGRFDVGIATEIETEIETETATEIETETATEIETEIETGMVRPSRNLVRQFKYRPHWLIYAG